MNSASVPECKCSLRTSLVGDGCSACNPEMAARVDAENAAEDRLHDAAEDMLAALEMIDACLKRAWDNRTLPASVMSGKQVSQYQAAIAKATGVRP